MLALEPAEPGRGPPTPSAAGVAAPSLRPSRPRPGASSERSGRHARRAADASARPPSSAGVPGVHVRMEVSESARTSSAQSPGLADLPRAPCCAAGLLRPPAPWRPTLGGGARLPPRLGAAPWPCAGGVHPAALPCIGPRGAAASAASGASAARSPGLQAGPGAGARHAARLAGLAQGASHACALGVLPADAGRLTPMRPGDAGLPGALRFCLCSGRRGVRCPPATWPCSGSRAAPRASAGPGTGSRHSAPKRASFAPALAFALPRARPSRPALPPPGAAGSNDVSSPALREPRFALLLPCCPGRGWPPRSASSSCLLACMRSSGGLPAPKACAGAQRRSVHLFHKRQC
jgi:hypothetical protein